MDIHQAYEQLRYQGQTITSLVAGLTEEQARWKPEPESWSVLEILNHLVDEEILDFRAHLGHILFSTNEPWSAIDPEGWVHAKKYNERNLGETVTQFKSEREKSIAWLTGLSNPNWDAAITLEWGDLMAGDMLASWLAHDLLHLRQLVALRYQLTQQTNLPYRVGYAGQW